MNLTKKIKFLCIGLIAALLISAAMLACAAFRPVSSAQQAHAAENGNNIAFAAMTAGPDGKCDGSHTGSTGLTGFTQNLSGGDYHLENAITATSDLTIASDITVNLCLNGQTLDMASSSVKVESGATLNIYDCSVPSVGNIKGSGSSNGMIYLNGGALNLYGGTVSDTGSYATSTIFNNGAGAVNVSGGTVFHPKGRAIFNNGAGAVNVSGGTVSSQSNYAIVNSGALGAVNISDSAKIGTKNAPAQFGVLMKGGDFAMNGGAIYATTYAIENQSAETIDISGGSLSTKSTNDSYAICNNSGAVNISGSAEIGTKNAPIYRAVLMNGGDFAMNGGAIYADLYAIYNKGAGAINISGGSLSSYSQTIFNTGTGKIYLSGNPTITGGERGVIYLANADTLVANDGKATLNYYRGNNVALRYHSIIERVPNSCVGDTIVSGVNDTNKDKFSLNNAGSGGSLKYDSTAKTLKYDQTHICNGITFDNKLSAFTATLDAGNYFLTSGISATGNITINGAVNLCLNGQTLNMAGYSVNVNTSGAALHIYDCSAPSTGKISGSSDSNGVIYLNGGALNLYGGAINATNKAIKNDGAGAITISGGAVYSRDSYAIYNKGAGAVTISGGAVSSTKNNAISNYGAGEIKISGGAVSSANNFAINNNDAGEINISGGAVSSASDYAIYNYDAGAVTISGGASIGAEKAPTYQGVYMKGGILTMTGGTIYATQQAIFNSSTGAVTISGGAVSSASDYAIYNYGTGAVTISDGASIGAASAPTKQGVYMNGGDFAMNGGTIYADFCAIYNFGAGAVNISGGAVTGKNDYAIYNNSTGDVTISGGASIGAASAPTKHGVYMRGGDFAMNGRAIYAAFCAIFNEGVGAIHVSGGALSSSEDYAIYNYGDGIIRLSGTPTITGGTSGAIYLAKANTLVANDGNATYYSGDNVAIRYYAPKEDVPNTCVGNIIVSGVNDTNKGKFTLVNAGAGCSLKYDSANGALVYSKETYNVTHTLSNITATADTAGDNKATYGEPYTTTLTAATGYSLPNAITVTIGGAAATQGTDYTYSNANGEITIPAEKVTGAIVITARGEIARVYYYNYVVYKDGDNFVVIDKDPNGTDATEIYRGNEVNEYDNLVLSGIIDDDRENGSFLYKDCAIDLGGGVVLDLGDKKLTFSQGTYAVTGKVTGRGTRVIEISGDFTQVTLNADITSTYSGTHSYAAAINILDTVTKNITVTGGTITSESVPAIYHEGNSTLVLNETKSGLRIASKNSVKTGDNRAGTILIRSDNSLSPKLAVVGGTIENNSETGVAVYAYNINGREKTIVMTGVKVKGGQSAIYATVGDVFLTGCTVSAKSGNAVYGKRTVLIDNCIITQTGITKDDYAVWHDAMAGSEGSPTPEECKLSINGITEINGTVFTRIGIIGTLYDGAKPVAIKVYNGNFANGITDGLTVVFGTADASKWILKNAGYALMPDDANQNLIAKASVKASFDMGGVLDNSEESVNVGSTVTKPADPTAEGFAFGGWYADAGFAQAFDFGTAITSATTIYAKWTLLTPDVSINDVNTTYDGATHDITVAFNTQNDKITYTYQWSIYGDFEDCNGGTITYRDATTASGSRYSCTVTAKFGTQSTSRDITATVIVNKATLIVTAKDQTIRYGDTISQTGYTLSEFLGADDISNSYITGDPTLTANAMTVADGNTINIDVQEMYALNYTFVGVSGNLTINKADYTSVPAHGELTGIYDKNNTLANYPLNADFWWKTPTETPAVAVTEYEAFYNADPDNYNDLSVKIKLSLSKQKITAPAIEAKTYNGKIQTADLTANGYFTVTQNNGGKDASADYVVTLTLQDFLNTEWDAASGISGTNNKTLTLSFEITKCKIRVKIVDQRSAQGKDLVDLANATNAWLVTDGKPVPGDDLGITLSTLADKNTVAFTAITGTAANTNYQVTFVNNGEYSVYSIAGFNEFMTAYGSTIELTPGEITYAQVADIKAMHLAYEDLEGDNLSQLTFEQKEKIVKLNTKADDIIKAKLVAEATIKALEGATVETIREEGIDKLSDKNTAAKQAIDTYKALSNGLKAEDLSGYTEYYLPIPILLKDYNDNFYWATRALDDIDSFKAEDLVIRPHDDDRRIIQSLLDTAIKRVADFAKAGGTNEKLVGYYHIDRVSKELYAFDAYLVFFDKHEHKWEMNTDNMTLGFVALLKQLDTAYVGLKTNPRAVSLLTAEEVEKIELAVKKGKDVYAAKAAAEQALSVLVGATADSIRQEGAESFSTKVNTAKTAIDQYVAFAKGNLKITDLLNHGSYDLANGILNHYTATLIEANTALAALKDKTAQGLVDKTYMRAEIVSLLDSAAEKVADFVTAGGATENGDLACYGEIARVKGAIEAYDGYLIFVGAHKTTWQISLQDMTLADGAKVTALQAAYEALSVEIEVLLTADDTTDIEAVIQKSAQISTHKDAADAAIGELDGITAEGLRNGTFDLVMTEKAIATAKSAAKSYTDLSNGVTTADLADYGSIAAAEQAVADYKTYKAFADSHGEVYAKDPRVLTYAESMEVNTMYAAYLLLTEDVKSVLTEEESANITALKEKADALIAKKADADAALEALKDALTAGAEKESLQDLLADAFNKTESFFEENGTAQDLPAYGAIQDSKDKITEYEKQEFEQQIAEDLGAIEDFTPDVVGGLDIPSLEDTIDKVQDAIDKIDASSDKTKDELADKREELVEVKDNLTQKLNLEKTKITAITELKAEREKLLASSVYSSTAKKEIAEYYANAIEQITLATGVSAVTENKDACIEEMNSVEILHVGLLVANLVFAALLIGEILFLVFRKKIIRKKKETKTYSSALPLVLLAAASGGGLTVGVTFLVILILAVVVLGIYIADKILREIKGKTVFSPAADKVDEFAKKCVLRAKKLVDKKGAEQGGTSDLAADAATAAEELSETEAQTADVESPEKKSEAETATVVKSEEAPQDIHPPLPSEYSTNGSNSDETAAVIDDEEETEVFRGVEAHTGLAILVRYKKSFLAKLIQSPDETKRYYSELKNALLSFNKVTSRISWSYDSINLGRTKLAKFNVRGKTLCLYLALNPDDFAETKYKVERTESKKYEATPCLYKIKNVSRATYALDLIAKLCSAFGLTSGEPQNVDYVSEVPYDTTESLITRGLIKELITKENYEAYLKRQQQQELDGKKREFVSASEVSNILSDEVAAALVETRYTKNLSVKAAQAVPRGKRGIVNIDTLSEAFASGETVTLASLKEKKLIVSSVASVKILARGTLDKPLAVEAQDFSPDAVKMILLTGGKAIKTL